MGASWEAEPGRALRDGLLRVPLRSIRLTPDGCAALHIPHASAPPGWRPAPLRAPLALRSRPAAQALVLSIRSPCRDPRVGTGQTTMGLSAPPGEDPGPPAAARVAALQKVRLPPRRKPGKKKKNRAGCCTCARVCKVKPLRGRCANLANPGTSARVYARFFFFFPVFLLFRAAARRPRRGSQCA